MPGTGNRWRGSVIGGTPTLAAKKAETADAAAAPRVRIFYSRGIRKSGTVRIRCRRRLEAIEVGIQPRIFPWFGSII